MKAIQPLAAGWEAYTQSRSPEAREQLIVQYLPLVKRVAARMVGTLPRSIRLDDLVSAGIVGLLSALDHFDPRLGVKFETFAMNRIRGSMVDSLRELDWVPRSIRKKARQLERAMDELAQRLGRLPQDQELADSMSVSIADYHQLLDEVNVAVLLSLDDSLPNSHGGNASLADLATDSQSISGQERVEEHETKSQMVRSLRLLPEQEKLVVALYYYEELTLKEIGDVLGLTESRVSQIHSKAMLKLRTSLRLHLSQ